MTIRAHLRTTTALLTPSAPPQSHLPPGYVRDMTDVARAVLGREPIVLWGPSATSGPVWIEGMRNMPVEAWMAAGEPGAGYA